MPTVALYLSCALSLATFCSLLIAASRVIKKQEREWVQNEDRLRMLEKEVRTLLAESRELVSITAKLQDIGAEIERLRNRLDRFLDGTRSIGA